MFQKERKERKSQARAFAVPPSFVIRHRELRSSNGSEHYPYNTLYHCLVLFLGESSPKQLFEKNGGNFGEKANETINYLRKTVARSAENGLNSQESKNYNFFESFNVLEQRS